MLRVESGSKVQATCAPGAVRGEQSQGTWGPPLALGGSRGAEWCVRSAAVSLAPLPSVSVAAVSPPGRWG